MIIIWPASIFAKRRIINANGFVKIPNISTGIKMSFTKMGTSGVKNMHPVMLISTEHNYHK